MVRRCVRGDIWLARYVLNAIVVALDKGSEQAASIPIPQRVRRFTFSCLGCKGEVAAHSAAMEDTARSHPRSGPTEALEQQLEELQEFTDLLERSKYRLDES
jgi:hypothetical protein